MSPGASIFISQKAVTAFRVELGKVFAKAAEFEDKDCVKGRTWFTLVVQAWNRKEGVALHRTFRYF